MFRKFSLSVNAVDTSGSIFWSAKWGAKWFCKAAFWASNLARLARVGPDRVDWRLAAVMGRVVEIIKIMQDKEMSFFIL